MNRSSAGRAVLALALAPVLVASLWLEVTAGTGTAWSYSRPGQSDAALLALWLAYAFAGPLVILVVTIRIRSRLPGITRRVLLIEKWGLIVAIPLGIMAIAIVAPYSIM